MTKKRSTKRALLASFLAMMLCVAMLVGTTYAWFTDSVTSGRNKIQSGNLDVVLEYWNGTKYEEVTSTTKLFDDAALWEPGYTEVAYLKVSNAGSLALKYQLAATVYNETLGKTKTGADIKLSDYLVFKAVESDADLADTYTRETAMAAAGTAMGLNTYNSEVKALEKKGDTDYVALIIYMPTTVGNEANHDGVNVPSIEMGVNLFATQYTYEEDSFDNQYDDIALVGTSAELKEALEAGKNTMLTNDIVADFEGNYIIVPADADVVLDMNGYDIAATTTQTNAAQCIFTVRGKMNVIGNGTASIATSTLNAWSNRSAVFSVEANGELTLNKGVTLVNEGDFDMAFGVDVLSNGTMGSPVLNINGATIVSPYTGVRLFNNSQTHTTTVNYNSGVVYGATRDIWAQKASDKAPVENAIVNIADGITYETTTQESGGVIYQMKQDVSYVFDADSLTSAIKAGGKVVFGADITVDKWIMFSETLSIGTGQIITIKMDGLTIDGNGHTLTVNSIESAKNGDNLFHSASNLNISNLTIKNNYGSGGIGLDSGVISNVNFVGGGKIIYPGTGEITVENCTFTNTGDALYFEQERNNLTVTGCTFNQPAGNNVILLRGDVKFTNNIVNSGRTVNIVSGSPVVTGNNFNNVRLKVYSAATATISGNTINNLEFETTTYSSDFANNTLSAKAQSALDAVTKN